MIHVSWQEHINKFNELNQSGTISIKEYADHYGLNYNTARKHLTKKTDHSDGKTIPDPVIPPAKRSGLAKKSAPKKRTIPRTARDKRGVKGGAATHEREQPEAKEENAGAIAGDDSVVISIASRKPRVDKGKPHKPKTDQSWKLGASAIINDAKKKQEEGENDPTPTIRRLRTGIEQKLDIYDIDLAVKDMKAEIRTRNGLDDTEADILISAKARRLLLENAMKIATSELSIMIDCYNGIITPDDPRYVDLGKDPKHPIFTHGKSISEAHYAISDCLKTISHLLQNTRKATKEDGKDDKEERINTVTAEIYAMLSSGDISPLDAALQLEAKGIKPPPFLLAMANKELTEEPPVDPTATSAVDQEQLDKEARMYAEMKEGKEAFLEKRRKAVAGIVDRGGYGDLDEDGQRREGEGLSEYDDEELDVEATLEQYQSEGEEEAWSDD